VGPLLLPLGIRNQVVDDRGNFKFNRSCAGKVGSGGRRLADGFDDFGVSVTDWQAPKAIIQSRYSLPSTS
jgi:hypothetical protein